MYSVVFLCDLFTYLFIYLNVYLNLYNNYTMDETGNFASEINLPNTFGSLIKNETTTNNKTKRNVRLFFLVRAAQRQKCNTPKVQGRACTCISWQNANWRQLKQAKIRASMPDFLAFLFVSRIIFKISVWCNRRTRRVNQVFPKSYARFFFFYCDLRWLQFNLQVF